MAETKLKKMESFGFRARQSNVMRSGRRPKKDKKATDKPSPDSPAPTQPPTENGDAVDNNVDPASMDVSFIRDSRNCCITGMKFVTGGDLVLIDSANYCLKIIDVDRKRIKSWTEIRYKPWDLAELEPGSVVVTCPVNKKLLFITLSNGYTYRQLLLGGVCYGVIVHDSTFIVSFSYPNPEVQFLSQDGQKLKSVNIFTTGQPLFKNPRYLTLAADSAAFYVSDWSNDTIYKVTMSGGIEGVYSHRLLKDPRGVVTQGRARIYVAGMGSNNIGQLSSKCDHEDIIKGEKEQLHLPQCIAIRQKNKSSVIELFISQDGLKQNEIALMRWASTS